MVTSMSRGNRGTQLVLPWDPPIPRTADTFVAGSGRALEARARFDGTALVLGLERIGRPGRFTLELDVGPRACCRVDGADGVARWPLWSGVPMFGGTALDPFRRALRFAFDTFGGPGGGAPVRGEMRRLYHLARGVAAELAARCDPIARSIALRFPAHARFFVYAALVGDPSRRVAQLAEVCPGALGLAAAFERLGEPGGRAAAAALVEGVRRGRRLDRLLGEAVESWCTLAAGARPGALDVLAARIAHEARPERLRSAQRLSIRRATAEVPGHLLWAPPPLGFAPEHLPGAPREVAIWFRVAKGEDVLLAGGALDAAIVESVSRFVSRHALEIWPRVGRRARRVSGLVRALLAHRRHVAGPIAASASAAGTLDAAAAWHDALTEVARAEGDPAALVGHGAEALLRSRLPPPPWPAVVRPGFEARPITDVAGLLAEAESMRHCVLARAPAIFEGRAAIYTITLGRRRLTAELVRGARRWRLAELRGFANAPPTPAEQRAVAAWARAPPLLEPAPACEPPALGLDPRSALALDVTVGAQRQT
jgi:hypothetical protein